MLKIINIINYIYKLGYILGLFFNVMFNGNIKNNDNNKRKLNF